MNAQKLFVATLTALLLLGFTQCTVEQDSAITSLQEEAILAGALQDYQYALDNFTQTERQYLIDSANLVLDKDNTDAEMAKNVRTKGAFDKIYSDYKSLSNDSLKLKALYDSLTGYIPFFKFENEPYDFDKDNFAYVSTNNQIGVLLNFVEGNRLTSTSSHPEWNSSTGEYYTDEAYEEAKSELEKRYYFDIENIKKYVDANYDYLTIASGPIYLERAESELEVLRERMESLRKEVEAKKQIAIEAGATGL